MTAETESMAPLAIYDAHEDNWIGLAGPERNRMCGWMREQGIEPNDTRRVEIYLLDCLFARVVAYATNADGDHYGHGCEFATRTYTVGISSMPPVRPWPEGRAA